MEILNSFWIGDVLPDLQLSCKVTDNHDLSKDDNCVPESRARSVLVYESVSENNHWVEEVQKPTVCKRADEHKQVAQNLRVGNPNLYSQ